MPELERSPTGVSIAAAARNEVSERERLLQALATQAWWETAHGLIGAIGRGRTPLAEATRAIALIPSEPLPAGVTALAEHLAARLPEPLRAEFLASADWHLHTFRGGRKVQTTHRLEALPPPGELPEGTASAPEPGFDAEVLALDLSAPHSMGDLSRYANAYLGRPFVHDAIENAREVELHNGTAAEAMASLLARGARSFHHLATPKLHFQILLTDDLRYAIACDDGPDMFRHLQKVLRAVRLPDGRRLAPERLTRVDHRPDEAVYRQRRLRRCFESSGAIPRQVTVGFKNALLGELAARAQRVSDVRGWQARRDLPSTLAPLRDFDARELLHSAPRRRELAALEAAAHAEGCGGFLAGTERVRLAASDGPDGFLDHSRLVYLDAQGRRREVLLVRNPYGEAAVAMGALFRSAGVEQLLVYGTAAALEPGATVGELHLASSATTPDGRTFAFENGALDAAFAGLHAASGARRGSRVVNVRSPLDELDREIDRLRADGFHLIEMELAGLLRGLGDAATRVLALHVVSDVPQSESTLEAFSPTRAQRALEAAVDVWVAAFGIAELEA